MSDDRDYARNAIMAQIVDLEIQQQPRVLRELALGSTTALARVQDIDTQIAALRAQLATVT